MLIIAQCITFIIILQLSDDSGNALAVTYINPAVTTNTRVNPSMRVFYLDNETYEVIDFEQYGFNLFEASGSIEL